MIRSLTLPILGTSLFMAAAAGVHLGESSIGLINPIHFQGPAPHPRERGVAIYEEPLPLQPRRAAYAELYGWDEGAAAQAAECGDCFRPAGGAVADPEPVYSAIIPYFGPEESEEAEPEADPVMAEPDPAHHSASRPAPDSAGTDPIVRYSTYPVEEVVEERAVPMVETIVPIG